MQINVTVGAVAATRATPKQIHGSYPGHIVDPTRYDLGKVQKLISDHRPKPSKRKAKLPIASEWCRAASFSTSA